MTTDTQRHLKAKWNAIIGLCLFTLTVTGCGNEPDKLEVVSAEGTLLVKLGGKTVPIEDARIVFHPVENEDAFPKFPAATTGEDGSFKLGTYEEADGAPEGEYIVVIDARKREKPKRDILGQGERPVGRDRLGGRYTDPKKSKLRVTVKEGEPIELVVSPRP